MNLTNKTSNILVVDDDLLNLQLMARTLASAGFTTVPAANGEEAVEWMKAQQFDAVVTDVQMPHMNGIELLQYIRASFPWLPVIIMTGLVHEDISEAASAWGAAALFSKPVNRGELIAALRMALADAAPPFAPVFATEAEAVAMQAV
jgi:CheY-like chemotaxis protein